MGAGRSADSWGLDDVTAGGWAPQWWRSSPEGLIGAQGRLRAMPDTSMNWTADNRLTVRSETQTFNVTTGSMDITVHGEITESAEWWLEAVAGVLGMLPGKTNDAGTEFLLGPVGSDPDMIGTLVAAKLRDRMPG